MSAQTLTPLIDTLSDARAYFEEEYRWEKLRIGAGGSQIAMGRARRYADAIAQAALLLGQLKRDRILDAATLALKRGEGL